MPTRSLLLGFVVLFTLPLAPVAAALELTPFLGYRFGTTDLASAEVCIAIPGACPDGETSEDIFYGLALTHALSERWFLDLRLSRQESELEFEPFICPECSTIPFAGDLEQTTILLGLERRFTAGRVQPFVAFGAGLSQLESDSGPTLPISPIDEDRFAASVAGGLRVPLTELLTLRLEARGTWTDLPPEVADELFQVELSSGLTFSF